MFDDRDSGSSALVAFLLGGIAGVSLAVLFAPRSGADTREAIGETLRDGAERGRALVDQGRDAADRLVASGRDATDRVREAGSRVAERGRDVGGRVAGVASSAAGLLKKGRDGAGTEAGGGETVKAGTGSQDA